MSRPYSGAWEARQAAAEISPGHARDVAETWVQDLVELGLEAPTLRKVRNRLLERIAEGETLPGLDHAAMIAAERLLTARLES